MEPGNAFKKSIEIEVLRFGFGNGAARAVINDFGRAHGGAGLEIIDAKAVSLAKDARGIDAILAKGIDGCLADIVIGDSGEEKGIAAIVSKADGDVGLASAIDHVEGLSLAENGVIGSG